MSKKSIAFAVRCKTENPCWNNGNGCPERKAGCAATCAKWAEYAKAHAEERSNIVNRSKDVEIYEDYHCRRVDATKRKK